MEDTPPKSQLSDLPNSTSAGGQSDNPTNTDVNDNSDYIEPILSPTPTPLSPPFSNPSLEPQPKLPKVQHCYRVVLEHPNHHQVQQLLLSRRGSQTLPLKTVTLPHS
jgi:hypothetical protein